MDVENFHRTLHNGLKNKNPKSPLAHCLSSKKTIRWGNKTDPFQKAEKVHELAPVVFNALCGYEWSFVIQTMHTDVMMGYLPYIISCKDLVTVMPQISPGLDKDWEVLEKGRTNPPRERLHHIRILQRAGVNCGVNGEPFIPGYHTVQDFEDTLQLLKSYGVKSYNTYNLHFHPFVAKRLHEIGIDIERIWYANQDAQWKPVLAKLLDLSVKYDITLGCPDFVNTGPLWREKANTCCGVNVQNPTTWNTHHWKSLIQQGNTPLDVTQMTYDGSGEWDRGLSIINGTTNEFYTLRDAGL